MRKQVLKDVDFGQKIVKTVILIIFNRLQLMATLINFNKMFSIIYITDIYVQNVSFKFLLQAQIKRLKNTTFTFFSWRFQFFSTPSSELIFLISQKNVSRFDQS